jgi:hypothetical protein
LNNPCCEKGFQVFKLVFLRFFFRKMLIVHKDSFQVAIFALMPLISSITSSKESRCSTL